MKKFLLLIVILAIGAAAYFARPQNPQASLSDYLVDKASKKDSVIPTAWNEAVARGFADHCEYSSHLLWVDAKYQDKTIYTSVFGRWINRAELKRNAQFEVEKAKEKMDHAADKLTGKAT